ncbi:MAG: AMP-binding protein [Candidatus Sulfotelmatobacter sp.]
MPESLADFLLPRFDAHLHERAYGKRRGYRMEWFTYGQIVDLAIRFAHELDARQIRRGDRVMLWGENCAEWVAAFLGCAIHGVVVVPMDDGAASEFALRVLLRVEAKLLVCSRAHLDVRQHTGATVLVLEDLLTTLKPRPANAPPSASVGPDDALQIVFTSGTTAEPKGVVITHGNVLANLKPLERQIQGYLKYERLVHPVRFLCLLPLSHVFGQFLGMFLPPLLGGTVIFQNEFKPSEIVDTIRRERISVLASVPRVLQSLKQKVERDLEYEIEPGTFRKRFDAAQGKHFLRRWWIFRAIRRQFGWKFWAFIAGGAALDGETEEFWGRLGYAVIQGYGLTETTSLISVNHPFRLGKGSIGKVLPGREVKLADDGEILVRGAGVASGYWRSAANERVDAISAENGWYRTGDIGALDAAGNLYFKGRKKDVIVTPAGLNIYPDDLEGALRRQPEVKDCVVVGIDRGGNQEPCAVLIPRGNGSIEAAVRHANESLAEYQQMRIWFEWPEQDFPRTSTQKPRKKLVQEFAQAQISGSRQSSEVAATNSLAELIASVKGHAMGAMSANSNLETDLGLSSLDRVELLGAIEERYQVDLGDTRFSAARTVGDLEKLLHGDAVERVVYHYPQWTLRWPVRWIRVGAHYLLMRPAMAVLGWPQIEGRENLNGWNGPLLVISNHIDDVDVGFIQTALPARFRHWLATATGGEALEALRSPAPGRGFLGRVYDRLQWALGVGLLNLFPLPRQAGFRQSFAYAGEAVDRGYSILVFPEGRHTLDGNILPFREGIGLLAGSLGVPVLPVRISGLFEVKQAGRKFAPPGKIRVRIGHPIKFDPGMDAKQIAAELQRIVEAL